MRELRATGRVMRRVTVSLEQATSILGATASLLGWETSPHFRAAVEKLAAGEPFGPRRFLVGAGAGSRENCLPW